MKKFLSYLLNPFVLCFILTVSIALLINHLAQHPAWMLFSFLGIPTGLLTRYLIDKLKRKE